MKLTRMCAWFYDLIRKKQHHGHRRPVKLLLQFGTTLWTLPHKPGHRIGEHMQINVLQQIPISITGSVDAKGNTLPVPSFAAPPSWASSDTTIATVAPAADGLSAVVTAVGKTGTVTITASGTVSGQTSAISGTSEPLDIVSAPAVSLTLTFGTATNQVPPTPPPPPPPAA